MTGSPSDAGRERAPVGGRGGPLGGTAEGRAGPAEWSERSRQLALVALAALVVWLVYLARPVLRMLVMAAVIAFLLNPAVQRLTRRGWRRSLAVATVYAAVIAFGLTAAAVVVPELVADVQKLSEDILALMRTGRQEAIELLERVRSITLLGGLVDLSFAVDPALDAVRQSQIPLEMMPSAERLIGSAEALVRTASGLVAGLSTVLFTLVFTLTFAVHMSLDGARLIETLAGFTGEVQSAEYSVLARRVTRAWSGFFRGQLQLSVIIGVVIWLGASLLGLSGAMVLGISAGILEVVPNIGPVLALVPAVAVALIDGSSYLPVSNVTFALIVIVFYAFVQQLENAVIVPRVIGTAVNVPPLVVLVAVIVGASVAGVLGAFLAAPTVATLREIITYTASKIQGVDPYPELAGAGSEQGAAGGAPAGGAGQGAASSAAAAGTGASPPSSAAGMTRHDSADKQQPGDGR